MYRSYKSLAAILLLPLLAACDEAESTAVREKPVVPVIAERVAFSESTVDQGFSATIEPRVVSDLSFRIQGKVTSRLANVGDRVRKGQLLAILDDADLKLQLIQAQAEEAAAANVLHQQLAEERRLAQLLKDSWVAASAYDRQKAALDEARARLERAQKAVELSTNAVSYAILTADGDGIVTRTSAEAGQVLGPGQTAVTVAREGELEASVSVPETRLKQISDGEARVEVWADPVRSYRARLRELSPVADPATRTYAARFTILDPGPDLKFGMSAKLTITTPDRPGAAVPLAALLDQGGGPAVWLVNPQNGLLAIQPVEVASYGPSTARITGGLVDGDYVVVAGAQKLDGGLRARIVDPHGR
jgi:RND family efflux transporter MFP subunit